MQARFIFKLDRLCARCPEKKENIFYFFIESVKKKCW